MLTLAVALALATASPTRDASPQARATGAGDARRDTRAREILARDTFPRVVLATRDERTARRDSANRHRATAMGEVRGRVIDAGADVPLAAASLTIEGNGATRLATSALDGAFAFAGVSPGRYTLVVVRTAYRPTRLGIVVPEGSALVLDVQLTRLPVALAPMLVQASRDDEPALAPGFEAPATRYADGASSSRAATLLASPGGMSSALLGVLPSRRPTDPGGNRDGRTLFIWGAKDAGARVTLDGVPLGAPLHLGGLLPVVDEDLMAPARMWSGGAPARYDGGTDYVLDLRTRAANRDSLRLWGTFDVLSERIGGELPIGEGGSLLAGARRVHDGSLARRAGADPDYGYGDGLVRLQLRPSAGHELRATAFITNEALELPRDQGRDEARWGNRAGALAWERTRSSHGTLVRAGLSDAIIDLPLLTLRDGHLRADARRLSLLAEQRWGGTRAVTALGAEAERFDVQRAIDGDSLGGSIPAPPKEGPPCGVTAACSVAPNAARVTGTTTGLYVDHRRLVASWLQLGVGLRGVIAPGMREGSRALLLPRLALEATPSSGSTVRVGVGSFSRAATLFDEANGVTVLQSTGLAAAAGADGAWMSQSTATQFEVGASQRWTHALLGVVAYWQRPQVTGLGQSALRHRGVDATWQYARGVTSFTASYSRVNREIRSWDADTSAELLTTRLEQVASLGAATHVWKVHGSLSASYAHGLSFASVVLERPNRANTSGTPSDLTGVGGASAPPTIPPQRSFLRVDASISGRICVAGPSCRLVLAPYARVLNALDRRDAIFFYRESPARNANRLGWVPALLSLGLRVDVARDR